MEGLLGSISNEPRPVSILGGIIDWRGTVLTLPHFNVGPAAHMRSGNEFFQPGLKILLGGKDHFRFVVPGGDIPESKGTMADVEDGTD
jgi:hypothetical protein